MKHCLLFLVLFSLCGLTAKPQFYTNRDTVNFSSSKQNMWGPGSAFSINRDTELFRLNPGPQRGGTGNSMITTILGQQFGFGIDAELLLDIGSNFRISGFTAGEVEVDYPINVELDVPDSNSFEKGETITIHSDYSVLAGAGISTLYPQGGRSSLDFHFGFGVDVNTRICVFSCADIHLLPPVSSPRHLGVWPPLNFSIFSIEQDLATGTITGTYPCSAISPCGALPKPPCIPRMCSASAFPINIPDNGLGITGALELPNVITSSTVNADRSLSAFGDHPYLNLNLDMLDFLSNFANRFPPPAGPAIGSLLGNLNNTFNLPGGTTASYSFFTADFGVTNTNTQRFQFKPKVFTQIDLPSKVIYSVIDPVLNDTLVKNGFDKSIKFEVGHDVSFKYPCNQAFMQANPTYSLTNNFANRTYDSLSVEFAMSALTFELTMPRIVIIPAFTIWPICTSFSYPCGCCIDWCRARICIPPSPIRIPEVGFGPLTLGIGPLWQTTIPIGSLSYDWFNDNWEMPGFSPESHPGFRLVPREYFVDLTAQDVLCHGDSSGQVFAEITNGTPPYTYNWSNGTVKTQINHLDTITDVPAGNHFVTITDDNGCQTFGNIVVKEPLEPLTISNIAVHDVGCFSGNDGKLFLSTQGGTGTPNFSWAPAVSTADSAVNLIADTYHFTVSDANGCTINDSAVVNEPTALSSSIVSTDALCLGGNEGTIDLTVSGGTLPYRYLWSDAATSEDRTGLTAGKYIVQITDAEDCVHTDSVTLLEPAVPLNVQLTGTDVNCFQGNDGTATAAVTGGTTPYNYQWANSSLILLSTTSQNANGLTADQYIVTVTDSNQCLAKDTIAIDQPASGLSIALNATDVSCNGGNDGAIALAASGGTTPYRYWWSNAANTKDLNNLITGTYTVTLSDTNNCTITDSIKVNEPPAPLSITATTTHVLCFGENTGSANATVIGGTPPYRYLWSNGDTTLNTTKLTAGPYTLTATDNNDCNAVYSLTIQQPAQPLQITPTVSAVSCFGGSDGEINALVNGGTTPYQYQWSDSNNVILSTTSPTASLLQSGNYTLLTTDSNACTTSQVIHVPQPIKAIDLKLTAKDVSCHQGKDGSINLTVDGGTPPYRFKWSNTSTNQHQTGLTAGWYQVVVTDANECSDSIATRINQPAEALTAAIEKKDVSCFDGTNGDINLTVTGGTPPYRYNWSNGATEQDLPKIGAGTYTVVVTDSLGCTANSGTVINQPNEGISVSTTVDSVDCYNGENGAISVVIAGGTLPYKVNWGDSTLLINNVLNKTTLSNLRAGVYRLIITDQQNCLHIEDISVFQPQTVTINYTEQAVVCYGESNGSIQVEVDGGIKPYRFEWSNGSAQQNLTNAPAGVYQMSITDNNNCRFIKENLIITQPDELLAEVEKKDVSCKDESDGAIVVYPRGGTPQYRFEWSNGQTTDRIENLPPGMYAVDIKDDHDCLLSDTFLLVESVFDCLEIPNTFTPNGDGKNDRWVLKNIVLYPNATVQVYNQWGLLLFESTGYTTPWDGRHNNADLPAGTYYYVIDLKNGSNPATGPVTIIR
jgi:gliding motility-associated-like protein